MDRIAYTVTATLPDDGLAREYAAWLLDDHVARVLAAGARSAEVIRIEDPPAPIRVETRYTFPGRAALARYLETHAPGLRAQGLERFGPGRGITFERTVGVIL
ncbi:MAG: DUF4286 family protein [Phycisphaerales bacterium]|nr:DUF4286 family protein [Phycisphaerales bacterium]